MTYIYILTFILGVSFSPHIESPAPLLEEILYTPETAEIIVRGYAHKWGVDGDKMVETVKCESSFNDQAYNRDDPYGGSRGVSQFLQSTFEDYAPLAGIENPDVWNPHHALETMGYMWSIGEQRQWSCYKILYE